MDQTVRWAKSEAEALRTVKEIWPNAGLKGELSQLLPNPAHFEQASKMVSEDDLAEKVICGPDPERHRAGIQEFFDAGFDHVYIHQIGSDQEGFFRFYEKEILPKFR